MVLEPYQPLVKSAAINTAGAGQDNLIAASAGKVVTVYAIVLVAAGAVTVKFQDAGTDLTGAMSLITGIPLVLPYSGQPWFQGSPGNAFNINLGGAVQVSGWLLYTQA